MTGNVMFLGNDRNLLEICRLILSSIQLQLVEKNVFSEENAKPGVPDLILMDDYTVPGGADEIRKIRSQAGFGDIPVIFLSHQQNQLQITARREIDFFLEKPFNLQDLETQVQKAIAHR